MSYQNVHEGPCPPPGYVPAPPEPQGYQPPGQPQPAGVYSGGYPPLSSPPPQHIHHDKSDSNFDGQYSLPPPQSRPPPPRATGYQSYVIDQYPPHQRIHLDQPGGGYYDDALGCFPFKWKLGCILLMLVVAVLALLLIWCRGADY